MKIQERDCIHCMIEIENLTYRVGSRILFNNTSLIIPKGKIGIVGVNGCGKTSLFRLILKTTEADSGNISYKKGTRLVCVQQEISDTSVTLLDFVLQSDAEWVRLNFEKDHAALEVLAEIYERLQTIDGFTAQARATSILLGLGFKQTDLSRPLREFSGGWQIRASLATTLFAPSDIILLDEPTNHLDFRTAIWLEKYLEKLNKTILIISHEKHFLNCLCDHIIAIYNQQLHLFKGGYDTYIQARDNQEKNLIQTIKNQEKKREHLQKFVDRFGAKATKAKQAQCRVKMIEKIEIPTMPNNHYEVKFSFPAPFPEVDRRLIACEKIAVGYENKTVLKDVNLYLDMGDRIAFIGDNGNGKSTLAKLLSGSLQPLAGKIQFAKHCKIAYFSQNQTDLLDVNSTPIETISAQNTDWNITQICSFLARFGITQNRGETKISKLSGGEKVRVVFALNALLTPHVMILDEPTNHLDIEAREALIEGLENYTGAVIIITHDFFILERISKRIFIVEGGTVKTFSGSLNDYKNLLLESNNSSKTEKTNDVKIDKTAKVNSSKIQRKKQATLLKLEKELNELEQQKKNLESKLDENYSLEIYEEYKDCCERLTQMEDLWFQTAES